MFIAKLVKTIGVGQSGMKNSGNLVQPTSHRTVLVRGNKNSISNISPGRSLGFSSARKIRVPDPNLE